MITAAPPIERLLVVRLSAMGDIIHTLPAVAALREAFPRATLGWLVQERSAELLCTLRYPRSGRRSPQRPLVDRVHTINTAAWRRSLFSFNTWQQMAVGLSELRGLGYEAAVDFQGAVRTALLARWSGAAVVYGDIQPRENAASMWYTRQVLTAGTHVVQQALSLAQAVIQRSGRGCARLRDSQSRRGLGSQAVALRTLRNGGERTGERRIAIADQLRPG